MLRIRKFLENIHDDRCKNIDFGTIFYLAGTHGSEVNNYVKENAEKMTMRMNRNAGHWLSCKIVYIEDGNPYFKASTQPHLYSLLLPSDDMCCDEDRFLAAVLDIEDADMIESAIEDYYSTLQKMLDELLDTGSLDESHLGVTHLFPCDYYSEKGASISRESEIIFDSEVRFSVCPKPFTFKTLSHLEITPNTYDFLLPDYNRRFHFSAQVKALYVLFLRHPEGILMKQWSDYLTEYRFLYFLVTNRYNTERIMESIKKLFDVFNPNALYVKKSQCNTEIRDVIPNRELSRYYEIESNRGREHKIVLDRSLVSMPGKLII